MLGDALRRLDAALRGDVRVFIVALGANDGFRGVPVERLKANLSQIIAAAQSRRIAVLLCAMEALPIHGWDYTVAFHQAYLELAAKFDVPYLKPRVDGHAAIQHQRHVFGPKLVC